VDSLGTLSPELGGNDTITAGLDDPTRNNIIFGGSGNDAITAGSGPNNIVLGDSGLILSAFTVNGTPNLALPLDGHLITLGQIGTTDPGYGSDAHVRTGLGHDIIFGGPGSDQIMSGDGQTLTSPG